MSHHRLEQPTSLTLLTLDQIIISHINSSLSKAPWEPTSVSPEAFEGGFRYHYTTAVGDLCSQKRWIPKGLWPHFLAPQSLSFHSYKMGHEIMGWF